MPKHRARRRSWWRRAPATGRFRQVGRGRVAAHAPAHPSRARRGRAVELGALRSRVGKQGHVLRRSATRLVVRFDGETRLARIQPMVIS